MMKRIILTIFLLLNFQFALAHVADDIKEGVGVEQAIQNALDACEGGKHCHPPAEIASALQAAGVSATDAATALSNAGIPDAVNITAEAYGIETAELIIALADASLCNRGGTGYGCEGNFGVGGGGGAGGGAVSN
jgi:hypothetical protein